MRYGVEYINGKIVETLEIEGHVVTKTWTRNENGTLVSSDKEFSEQLEGLVDEEIRVAVDIDFDGSTLASDIDDFVEINEIE